MNLKFIINKALTIPPHIFIKKVYFVILRKIRHIIKKRKDFLFSTYTNNNHLTAKKTYLLLNDLKNLNDNNLKDISKLYLEHRFDLLGSGWVKNSYDSISIGVEENRYNQNEEFDISNLVLKPNIQYSKKIYSLINDCYKPIDWQKDFKSGFRWSSKEWYLNQRNSILGVDIKVPWEIGRLQHLPQLALSCVSDYNELLIKEFKNQICDFIALNPPRFGVQWTCTMDVGIRVANMLIAHDIFKHIDCKNILDDNFEQVFSQSIYEHGVHIVNNLEYGENLTSNHYLSDIVGLLFVASYLECNNEINMWLGFAVQEVINEMHKQFYEDGSNFEASTSYHRLSSELMVYATALILGLDKEKCEVLQNYKINEWKVQPKLKSYKEQEYKILDNKVIFPSWYINRLYKSGKFTKDITKPTGEIVQFGDNDSGRFFRLSPNGEWLNKNQVISKYKNLKNYTQTEKEYWDENILNHQTLLCAMSGLFDTDEFNTSFKIEKNIIQSLAKNRKLDIQNFETKIEKQNIKTFNNLEYSTNKVFDIFLKDGKSLLDNLNFISYQDTGIYIFKSDRLYLAIWAGSNGQKGNGGHAHNDKLSFELNIDGKDIIVDAGTYLYTPLPQRRNQFRSTKAHNTLIVENEEQNEWIEGRYGLFSMKNQSKCYLLDFGDNFIDVSVEYRGIKQRRKFIVEKEKIVIANYSNKNFSENYNDFKLYSNGYGKLVKI
ncbi:alginate lyase family protein [Aliarcobacter butzleri]|uniref:alginate lyase family protein n=1 Tax=Aliarcobacter butzleri TaxID=28197 RepID=UPI002B24FD81|nr:alginate lyase family protein [Aliarcobacter butzleri]